MVSGHGCFMQTCSESCWDLLTDAFEFNLARTHVLRRSICVIHVSEELLGSGSALSRRARSVHLAAVCIVYDLKCRLSGWTPSDPGNQIYWAELFVSAPGAAPSSGQLSCSGLGSTATPSPVV
ncbi:hypothetical protein ILYODFUR_000927 [Ilyodon furcidens]|uniref:Uncharacterized protein n=1 Tax=Ilyodon furcidens TaxID=33524 RepID=A0ABV0UCB4_9TELE